MLKFLLHQISFSPLMFPVKAISKNSKNYTRNSCAVLVVSYRPCFNLWRRMRSHVTFYCFNSNLFLMCRGAGNTRRFVTSLVRHSNNWHQTPTYLLRISGTRNVRFDLSRFLCFWDNRQCSPLELYFPTKKTNKIDWIYRNKFRILRDR